MSIKVTCEECFFDYTLKDHYAGKKIRCKECGAAMRIPAVSHEEDDLNFADELEELNQQAREATALPKPKRKRPPKKKKERTSEREYSSGGGGYGGRISGGIGTFVMIIVIIVIKTGALQHIPLFSVSWKPYTTPDGNISLVVPGKTKEKKDARAPGVVNQRVDIADASSFGCSVTSIEFDQPLTDPLTNKTLSLAKIRMFLVPELIRQKPGAVQKGIRETNFSGIPALIVTIELPHPKSKRKKIIDELAIIVVDKYVYGLEFLTPKGRPQDTHKKKFFDSIKINDSLVQKYKGPNGNPLVNNAPQATPVPAPIARPPKLSPNIPPRVNLPPKEKKIEWEAVPDPLPEMPQWTIAKTIEIDLPFLTEAVHRPSLYGKTVVTGAKSSTFRNLSLYDLSTGERTAQFTGETSHAYKHSFSPDSKYLAIYKLKTGIIEVWDLFRSELTHKLIIDESTTSIHQMVFADATHLLTMQWKKPGIKQSTYKIYDLSEKSQRLNPKQTFTAPTMYYNDDFIPSPGGRYVAGKTQDRLDILLLDWKNEKFAGKTRIPDNSYKGSQFSIEGFNFSPDGKTLAVLCEASDETVLFGFSTTSGKIDWDHHWKKGIEELMPGVSEDTVSKAGHALYWLPDSSAVSFLGRMLVDVKTGETLWFLDSLPHEGHKNLHNNRSYYLTPEGMLSVESNGSQRQLQLLEFDTEAARKSLALLEQPDQVLIGPGKQVSVSIKIDKVHQAEKEEVEQKLLGLVTEKLEGLGFEVVEDADHVFNLDYRELIGPEWSNRARGSNGTIPSTFMQYRVQWLPKGKSNSLWESENQFSTSIIFINNEEGEPTAKKVRDKIYAEFEEHFLGRPIVKLIPKDPNGAMLPQFSTTKY